MQPNWQNLTSRQHTFFLNPDHDMLAMSGFSRCVVFLTCARSSGEGYNKRGGRLSDQEKKESGVLVLVANKHP